MTNREYILNKLTTDIEELAKTLVREDLLCGNEFVGFYTSDGTEFGIDDEDKAIAYEIEWLKKEYIAEEVK